MHFFRAASSAGFCLLVLGLGVLPVSAAVRAIDANSDPTRYVRLVNAAWAPPKIEPGYFQLAPDGMLLLPGISNGRPAKSFKLTFEARMRSAPVEIEVHYLTVRSFRESALSRAAERADSQGLAFRFSISLYRVRLQSPPSANAKLWMSLSSGQVHLGGFAAIIGSLAPLQNANGGLADLWLEGERAFFLEPHTPDSTLLFQPLLADCPETFGISKNADGALRLKRSRGTPQFSFDLVEWEDAGPEFVPNLQPNLPALFFREMP